MWGDLVAWLQSPGGARVLQTAIVPAVAIVVAGVLAGLIGRAAVRTAVGRADRVEAAGAVAGLVEAARAAADPDGDRGGRRRVARLRTEADVRTRLLPLAGADLAADFAARRIDGIRAGGGDDSATELADLRDRLVEWAAKPARAKRLFSGAASAGAAPGPRRSEAPPASEAAAPRPAEAPTDSTRAAGRPADAQAPRSVPAVQPVSATPPVETAQATEIAQPPAAAEAPTEPPQAAPAARPVERPATDEPPAWQRTGAVKRLQQERAARIRPAAPERDEDEPVLDTAPVMQQRPHREAVAAASADADESARLEAHQQPRHARQEGDGAPATGAVPAWLDTYDDEAQVTQNLDLKTPPPVAATSLRDRGGSGDDLVPRT